MSNFKLIATVHEGPSCWSAAIALVVPGDSRIDTATFRTEQAAEKWIGSRAAQLGYEHSDVEYHVSSRS